MNFHIKAPLRSKIYKIRQSGARGSADNLPNMTHIAATGLHMAQSRTIIDIAN